MSAEQDASGVAPPTVLGYEIPLGDDGKLDFYHRPEIVEAIETLIVEAFSGRSDRFAGNKIIGLAATASFPRRQDRTLFVKQILDLFLKRKGGDWIVLYLIGAIGLGDLRKRFGKTRLETLEKVDIVCMLVRNESRMGTRNRR